MTIHIGDFSNHDHRRGTMDFAAIARDGIAGALHKLTDGLNFYVDPYFAGAIGQMRAAFGWYGAYHVLWGDRDLNGQADWFLSMLDQACPWWRGDPNFGLMSDDEPFGYNARPTIDQVNTFGDLLRAKAGRTKLGYCPPWTYGADLARLRYPLVVSDYGANPAVHYPDAYPGDTSPRWHGGALLQYGSQTSMGNQATCDANAYRGTLDQLRALTTTGDNVNLTDPVRGTATPGMGDRSAETVWSDIWNAITRGGLSGGPGLWPDSPLAKLMADTKAAATAAQAAATAGAPTQAQVDAATAKVMNDPAWLDSLGKAVASHLHLTAS